MLMLTGQAAAWPGHSAAAARDNRGNRQGRRSGPRRADRGRDRGQGPGTQPDGQRLDRASIAAKLNQSPNTVRTHIRNVIVKLGCHSAIEAVAVGLRPELTCLPQRDKPVLDQEHQGASGHSGNQHYPEQLQQRPAPMLILRLEDCRLLTRGRLSGGQRYRPGAGTGAQPDSDRRLRELDSEDS